MMHENAYVASVSLSADVNQTVKVQRKLVETGDGSGPEFLMANWVNSVVTHNWLVVWSIFYFP